MKALYHPLQYACFKCRKSFKRPRFSGITGHYMTSEQQLGQLQDAKDFEENRQYKCPNCGGVAYFTGQDFKAPKRSDKKAWQQVQLFIASGKVYYRGTKSDQR
jgi:DNA-directed RNA polymerase subunit RPC12/RpoP